MSTPTIPSKPVTKSKLRLKAEARMWLYLDRTLNASTRFQKIHGIAVKTKKDHRFEYLADMKVFAELALSLGDRDTLTFIQQSVTDDTAQQCDTLVSEIGKLGNS